MKRKFLSILIPAFLLSACSTTISTRVKRPAQLDLEGARSIAVVPFQEAKRDGALVSILSILLTGSDPDKEKSETKKLLITLRTSLIPPLPKKHISTSFPHMLLKKNSVTMRKHLAIFT